MISDRYNFCIVHSKCRGR